MLNKLLNDLMKLNYAKNVFSSMKHEDSVKNILLSNNLTEINKKDQRVNILKKNKNQRINELKNDNIFINQPYGSQSTPDFIICVNGFIIWLECKSSKDKKIVWNSGYPKRDILYIFSSKKTNQTTLFYGQNTKLLKDNPDFEEKYKEFDKMLKELCDKFFKDLFKLSNNIYRFYMRRMLNDSTNYTDETFRKDNYNFVIDLLKEKGEL